jgi:hypothetical protein
MPVLADDAHFVIQLMLDSFGTVMSNGLQKGEHHEENIHSLLACSGLFPLGLSFSR